MEVVTEKCRLALIEQKSREILELMVASDLGTDPETELRYSQTVREIMKSAAWAYHKLDEAEATA